jgi:hypothetical protein
MTMKNLWPSLHQARAAIIVRTDRGVEASFSKTTRNKTLEFGGISLSNDLTRYKKESFYFCLIEMKCIDLGFCAPDDHPHSVLWGRRITRKIPDARLSEIERAWAAAISLIAREDFVIAEEFGQVYSLSNLWQPWIRNASVKIGNQIIHKSSVFPLTLA